eukprot:GHRQ01026974.1.p1 GENE.GHRQ01026974.1~~GHRQ01026974.1.p1  ORF type:complete len:202 (+),score=50.41 GHRQ01026974.1:588-1193(+)
MLKGKFDAIAWHQRVITLLHSSILCDITVSLLDHRNLPAMDPQVPPAPEQPEQIDDGSESSDAESDQEGRDTDISDSWGALPSTTQQMREQLDAVASKHATRGDQAFAGDEWQAAVRHYTAALKCTRSPQQEAALLSRRSRALCCMCKHIRSIPARTSERRAMYGHDPTHLVRDGLAVVAVQQFGVNLASEVQGCGSLTDV